MSHCHWSFKQNNLSEKSGLVLKSCAYCCGLLCLVRSELYVVQCQFPSEELSCKFWQNRKTDIFTGAGATAFIDSHYAGPGTKKRPIPENKVSRLQGGKKETKSKLNKPVTRRPSPLASDKAWLVNLSKEMGNMNIRGNYGNSVTRKALEGLTFLQRRDDFWNQIDTL